jgi:hypothetical protein
MPTRRATLSTPPIAPTALRSRHTSEGDALVEARIARDLRVVGERLRASLGPRLVASLLLGSYARGEGGVVVGADGQLAPYNDYDVVAVVRRGARGLRAPLVAIGHELTREVGVEVEVWPVDEADLDPPPRTLLWLDAALGGARVLEGDAGVLPRLARLDLRHVPLEEAARLAANRAVGLALSRLEGPGRDLLRAMRHGHKAILACGDATLLATGRYRPTLAERALELGRMAGAPLVSAEDAAAYDSAVRFHARPTCAGASEAAFDALRRRAGRWHLAIEAWRAGAPTIPLAFVAFPGRVYRDLADVPIAGWPAAVRAVLAGAAPVSPWLGHPRERLARAAVALAYGEPFEPSRDVAARVLGAPSGRPEDLLAALARLVPRAG